MKISMILIQLLFFLIAAPLASGLITRIKNNIRLRRGPGVLQPYHNLVKLFAKGEVISNTASWIFRIAPFVVISSVLTTALLIPVFLAAPARQMGDFLALVFILSLGRFFLALAGLDAGSSFGGMGSSREMFISSLVEPVLCLVIFSLSLQFGSTDISAFGGAHRLSLSAFVAALALFLLTLAETARVPVDNQETHLELTMVHEAMVLEYSGRSLAILEMAAYVKQMIFFFLIALIVFPVPASLTGNGWSQVLGMMWRSGGIVLVAVLTALVEVSVAKMRLFRVADFLGFAFILGVISAVCAIMGA